MVARKWQFCNIRCKWDNFSSPVPFSRLLRRICNFRTRVFIQSKQKPTFTALIKKKHALTDSHHFFFSQIHILFKLQLSSNIPKIQISPKFKSPNSTLSLILNSSGMLFLKLHKPFPTRAFAYCTLNFILPQRNIVSSANLMLLANCLGLLSTRK